MKKVDIKEIEAQKVVEETKPKGKVEEKKSNKLSYEELEKVAQQLSYQCQQLSKRVQERDMELTFKRLDYLFAVVNCTTGVFNDDFVAKCAAEIQEIMTPQPEEKE